MLKSRLNILVYCVVNAVKSKWLCVAAILVLSATSNAQLVGHNWTFADASYTIFNSTPAVAGTTGTLTLTVRAANGGSIGAPISDNLGLGTSCTGPILVRPFNRAVGLEFLNPPPRVATNIYTIELVVNLKHDGIYRRLLGFSGLSGAYKDNGIYVSEIGDINFYNGTDHLLLGSLMAADTWYHLVFTRNSSNVISYYRNGVLIGTYTDSQGDFVPMSAGFYAINILKDDTGEESSGKIARVGIYNEALSLTAVQERLNNICSTAISVESWNTKGNSGTTAASNFIGTRDNQPLIFKTNNAEAFRITPTGQVAIGTINPHTYKLAIAGGMIAEKVTVKLQTSWPDYVFHRQYKLPSLKEVEKFIQKNKHLPDVPSAKEIEEEGLELGDNQAILLKKIEELTLYLIEVNKKVDKLTEENKILKKKLETKGK